MQNGIVVSQVSLWVKVIPRYLVIALIPSHTPPMSSQRNAAKVYLLVNGGTLGLEGFTRSPSLMHHALTFWFMMLTIVFVDYRIARMTM